MFYHWLQDAILWLQINYQNNIINTIFTKLLENCLGHYENSSAAI